MRARYRRSLAVIGTLSLYVPLYVTHQKRIALHGAPKINRVLRMNALNLSN
jgi:hypothetical protein